LSRFGGKANTTDLDAGRGTWRLVQDPSGSPHLRRNRLTTVHYLVTVILREGSYQMIAEAPAPYCDCGAKLRYRREMTQARRAARTCSQARVRGVAFFDYHHGQDGVAPNAIELHPILGCLRP
jgi:hypothetical protein